MNHQPRGMRPLALSLALVPVLVATSACGRATKKSAPSNDKPSPAADYAPVAINPVSPIEYPSTLLAQQIEGRVLLRLYVDSTGAVRADSSRVAESSGYPALDSAALAGAGGLRFAPALHHGRPVALSFIQPVLFRSPHVRGATP